MAGRPSFTQIIALKFAFRRSFEKETLKKVNFLKTVNKCDQQTSVSSFEGRSYSWKRRRFNPRLTLSNSQICFGTPMHLILKSLSKSKNERLIRNAISRDSIPNSSFTLNVPLIIFQGKFYLSLKYDSFQVGVLALYPLPIEGSHYLEAVRIIYR